MAPTTAGARRRPDRAGWSSPWSPPRLDDDARSATGRRHRVRRTTLPASFVCSHGRRPAFGCEHQAVPQSSCREHGGVRLARSYGSDTATGFEDGSVMTRLINIDNGGTLTDVCVIDGDDVRYTKTLTTPFDLSSCLFDGLTKASSVVYGEERLATLLQTTDYIRYSTTQGTNALVQREGPRLGLLVSDPTVYARLAETSEQRELLAALV